MLTLGRADSTIFNRLKETRPTHSLTAALEATQPWGSLNATVSGSNYLDNWSKNRLNLSAGASIRIIRGLSLDFFGRYSRVRDQLSLEKEGASDEEVLLRLKQLRTSYFYSAFIGLSYTFGSKFNNIVNPRFTSSSGGNCFCSGGRAFVTELRPEAETGRVPPRPFDTPPSPPRVTRTREQPPAFRSPLCPNSLEMRLPGTPCADLQPKCSSDPWF